MSGTLSRTATAPPRGSLGRKLRGGTEKSQCPEGDPGGPAVRNTQACALASRTAGQGSSRELDELDKDPIRVFHESDSPVGTGLERGQHDGDAAGFQPLHQSMPCRVSTIFLARGTQWSLGRQKQSPFSCCRRAAASAFGCFRPSRLVPKEHR